MASGQEGPPEGTHQALAEMATPWQCEPPRLSIVQGGLHQPVDTRPRLKVLAVEDDQEDFEITADLMARAEDTVFEVSWSNDAEAALGQLAEGSFDACLVDLRLPGLDGLGFVDRVRAAGLSLPVILTSGVAGPETAFEAVERGFDDYVDKEELEVGQLERRIRFAVARRRQARALRAAADFREPPLASGEMSALCAALQEALAGDTLLLRYRPQEPLDDDDRVLAAELSLAGGRHDRLTTHHLLRLAEERQLAATLGRWMTETAIKDIAMWTRAGAGAVRLAIPFAAVCGGGWSMDHVLAALQRAKLDGSRIELEFDEAQLVGSSAETRQALDIAKSGGLRVAIAGFGRSIASLGLLRELAIDSVKLDPQFVIGRTIDDPSDTIPMHTIALCRRLGKRVVAENMAGFANLDQLSRSGVSAVEIPTSISNQNAIAWATASAERDPCWSTTERQPMSRG